MTLNHLLFNPDEFPANKEQIEFAERIWGTDFPQEYKAFLLEHNGGEVYPNIPSIKATTSSDFWELWGIERFCSIGDIILQKQYPMGYTINQEHEEEDLEKYNVSIDELLAIAIGDRGCYYLNLSKEQFGQIYFASYQDWDGFVRLETRSFTELLNSLKPYEDSPFEGFQKSRKIYDSRYFYTPGNPTLGLNRFKEVLSFHGDANTKATKSDWTVIQYYADVNDYIFTYLLNNGGKTEGLLLRTKNFETILKLIKEYGEDINKPYEGRYPLHMLAGRSSWANIKENYELLDKLLNSEIELDLNVKDNEGQSVIDRLKYIVIEYEKYREYDKALWESKPEMHQFITSEKINNIVSQ